MRPIEYECVPDASAPSLKAQKLFRGQTFLYMTAATLGFFSVASLIFFMNGGSPAPDAFDRCLEGSNASSGLEPIPEQFAMEPHGKKFVRQMDAIISGHIATYDWENWGALMMAFFRDDFTYDCVPFGRFEDIHSWFNGEHIAFNNAFKDVVFTQMIFIGASNTSSTTTYAKARWVGPLMGVSPGVPIVTFRICDFYLIPDKIDYNFMMFDVIDIFRQAGVPVVPPAPLPEEGYVAPPANMNGVPAPLSAFVVPGTTAITRSLALQALADDWEIQRPEGSSVWRGSMIWYGPAGFGVARGIESYRDGLLAPMHAAMSEPRVNAKIVSCEGDICGIFGTLSFRQVHTLFGEDPKPSSAEQVLELRFGFHYRAEGSELVEGFAMFDIPGLFDQWGISLYDRAIAQQTW